MRWSIGRCELASPSEDLSEPRPEILDASALRVPPDLGQVIAVPIGSLMLHVSLQVSEKRHFAPPVCEIRR
jgi:hypothetical protein